MTFIQSGLKTISSCNLRILRMKKVMHESSTGYIIDLYNRFAKNENVVSTFKFHGQDYCIREISQFEWGKPIFDRAIDYSFNDFCVYDTIEEAQGYIRDLKQIDGSKI